MNQMRSTRSAFGLLFLALSTQACSNPLEPAPPGSIFATSQTVYELPAGSKSAPVTFVATNTLDGPISLDGHDRVLMQVEKKTGDSWTVVHQPVYLAYWVPPILLLPGESRTYQIGVDVSAGPGTYRGVFGAWYGVKGGRNHSNEFEVRLAP